MKKLICVLLFICFFFQVAKINTQTRIGAVSPPKKHIVMTKNIMLSKAQKK